MDVNHFPKEDDILTMDQNLVARFAPFIGNQKMIGPGLLGSSSSSKTNIAVIPLGRGLEFENGTLVSTGGVFEKTYAELLALQQVSKLDPGQLYLITDRNIYIRALSEDGLSTTGLLKATNPDWQNVSGNFIGLWQGTTTLTYTYIDYLFPDELVTGGTSGATGYVTIADNNENGVIQVISSNGVAFQVGETATGSTSGNYFVVTTETTTSILGTIALNKIVAWNNIHYVNTTGSASIINPIYDTTNWTALATTDLSYQIEYDTIIYDFDNDIITSRQDKRGNTVTDISSYPNSITKFQWGRNTAVMNLIISYGFNGWNSIKAQQRMFIQDSSVTIGDSGWLDYSIITNRSTVIVFQSATARALNTNHSNYIGVGSSDGTSSILSVYSDVAAFDTTNAGTATFINAAITVTGTTSILGCHIDGQNSLITAIFASESHIGQRFMRYVYSNFNKSLSVTNLTTTLTLDPSGIYGAYFVTITGGVPSIDTIANLSINIPTSIDNIGANITYVNSATLRLKGGANKTLIESNEDFIQFLNTGVGSNFEYNSGQF